LTNNSSNNRFFTCCSTNKNIEHHSVVSSKQWINLPTTRLSWKQKFYILFWQKKRTKQTRSAKADVGAGVLFSSLPHLMPSCESCFHDLGIQLILGNPSLYEQAQPSPACKRWKEASITLQWRWAQHHAG
jgi:hypothetical protein